jgi:hypothetical protein
MGVAEVEDFLTDLAINGIVAASIQNQVFRRHLSPKEVLKQDLGREIQAVRSPLD